MLQGTRPSSAQYDPIRREKRLVVELEVQNNATSVPHIPEKAGGSFRLRRGVHQITCYESDWPKIEAMVEDQVERLEMARRAHEKRFQRYLDEGLRGEREGTERYAQVKQKLESRYPGSIEAEFHEMMDLEGRKTGIKPLAYAKVVGHLPEPEEESAKLVREVASQFIGANNGGGNDEVLAAIVARLESLESENADLRSKLEKKSSTRRRRPGASDE